MNDLLVQLQIIDAEMVRELWTSVGLVAVAVMGLIALGAVFAKFGVADKVSAMLRGCRRHPFATCILAPCVAALFVYAVEKKPLAVPQRQQCDFRCVSATTVTDGYVNYWLSQSITNIDVVMCGGPVTNELSFVTGQFYYEYNSSTLPAGDTSVQNNRFWVRDSETNAWTQSVLDQTMSASVPGWLSNWRGAVVHMPGYVDPKSWRYWFIGPEENLPEVVIEGGIGIAVDNVLITASLIHVEFRSEDPDISRSAHTYYLQVRRSVDGVLRDWETIASAPNVVGSGQFNVVGYTVGEYREYHIYVDKEVAE